MASSDTSTGRDKQFWLFQFDQSEAAAMAADGKGIDATPPADRHTFDIRVGDSAFYWVMGPGNSAGVFGGGIIEETGLVLPHSRDYGDPSSPESLRPSVRIDTLFVKDWPLVTREQLRELPCFEEGFELFAMANRQGAFSMTPEQGEVILDLLEGRAANR